MKFSTSIEYAIHGLIYVAKADSSNRVLTKDISESINVPEPYLRKVFQQLSRSGLVTSQRGVRGGFRLAREPDRITLRNIVEAIDGSLPVYTCVNDLRGCDLTLPCPVHAAFAEAQARMAEVLEATTIKDLLADISTNEPVAGWLQVTG